MHESLIPVALPRQPLLAEEAQLIAADVGGTKTDIALFEHRKGELLLLREELYPSGQFGSLSELIRLFHPDTPLPARLSIAFAGPVLKGKARATNLSWEIDIRQIARELGVPDVFLLNDLEAEAYGLAALKAEDLICLHPGLPPAEGNAGIIAPGTGLGEAGMYWDGDALHPFATEGGHTDFAPRTAQDWELLRYLQNRYGHVSWERLLSGPGIGHIYRFLRDVGNREEPGWLKERMQNEDPATVIGSADAATCPVCAETLQLFVQYLAVEASNLALKLKTTGGLFLGGGILPKIWNPSLEALFLEHFFEVGRLRPLNEAIPVWLIKNPKAVLLGAAYYGSRHVGMA